MKFTKNQSIVILVAAISWLLMAMSCYGTGVVAHKVAHVF